MKDFKLENFKIKTNIIMKTRTSIYHKTFAFASVLLVAVLFTGCADVTPIKECVIDTPYGFWSGLWHGIIAPLSFIGSLFSDDIAMYAVNNNGGWYDFGFVLGAGILFRGSSSASK